MQGRILGGKPNQLDEGATAPPPAGKRTIVLAAVGSRGDVQPTIVLALALRARGHAVHVATQDRLRPLVDSFGLAWRRLEGDAAGVLFEPEAQAALRSRSLLTLSALTKKWEARWEKRELLRSYEAALAGADVVVASALCMSECLAVAQANRSALCVLLPGPTWPTAEYPLWALPMPCACLNMFSYNVAFWGLWAAEKGTIDPWRAELGLAPLRKGLLAEARRLRTPVLVAAVHHCGVGTMAAALRAGVPQLPCPFMLDQPHNAALLLALGVAPAVVPFDRRVSSSRLAPPLRAILDEKGEGALGARVRAESAGAAERFAAIVEAAGPCEAEPRARI